MAGTPSYIRLYETGRLDEIADRLEQIGSSCRLCPRNCGVDRRTAQDGYCRSGLLPVVSSAQPHFGEEPPLVGSHGSGTIFFTFCNLGCLYCQNYDISHLGYGREVSSLDLAEMMLDLQRKGCHNINFVTPTHHTAAILKALQYAVPRGLSVPLVYNSGGYDSVEILELLEGVFDIYMPDFKYWEDGTGEELSDVKDYAVTAKRAVLEMHRQVGDLEVDRRGIASRGLIIRHLVLPGYTDESKQIIDFILLMSANSYLNLMDQYRPAYRSREISRLGIRLSLQEYDRVLAYAREAGLHR
jgi:putative pyruvate formate lyase activating enzyme